METKSKLFWLVFFLVLAGSVGASYYRFIFTKNYIIEAEADCDPMTEICFVYECDPATEECTGDPEEDTSYYKIVRRMAKNIPLCDPNSEGCDALMCPEGEADCEVALCDADTAPEGQICNNPEEYVATHPAEDEESDEDLGEGESSEDVESEDPGQDESADEEDVSTDGEISPVPQE